MNPDLIFEFGDTEMAYIAEILRGAYSIRTAGGEEDELLGDFIEALDNADQIHILPDGMFEGDLS